jgi:ferrous iron transport protein B
LAGYDGTVSAALTKLEALLPSELPGRRGLAIMALATDDIPAAFAEETHPQVRAIRQETAAKYSVPLVYALNQQRLQGVDALVSAVYRKKEAAGTSLTEWLSRIATHPIWGWPVLAAVLFGVYQFVGVFGAGTLVRLLENTLFAQWINPWVTGLVTAYIPIQVVQDFLVGEYGLVTMALSYGIAIVLPIVATFFLAFSLLEDSGYLPRLAVMVNRPFKAMGLNGKAVLPMVLGLGCDTMATMTTRILETRKERIQVTLLLALGVPCSAQLGVILGMVSLVSPTAMLLWGGVIAGVMLVVGWSAPRSSQGRHRISLWNCRSARRE